MAKFEINEDSVMDFIQKMGWQHKVRGREVRMLCPKCGKKDGNFDINLDKGTFKCFRNNNCGYSGNLVTLMRDHDYDPYKKKLYIKPFQGLKTSLRPKDTLRATLSFYGQTEGLKTEVMDRYEVGFLKRDGKVYVTFPYIDENGELLDVKYRDVDNKKNMRTEKDAKKIFFGQHLVKPGLKYLNVTEGEKDAMALAQYGYENVVSVPNGAGNVSQHMIDFLDNYKFARINLFFDSDKAGRNGSRNFAEKVGSRKCFDVLLPHKDAQDCLRAGVKKAIIDERIEVAKRFEVEEKLENATFLDANEQLERWEDEVQNYSEPIKTGFDFLDTMTGGGLFPGQAIGLMAEPGCYKTAFLQQLIRSISMGFKDEFGGVASMEMTLERETQRRLQLERGWSKNWLREQAKNNSDAYQFLKKDFLRSNENYLVSDKTHLTIKQIGKMVQNTEEQTGKKCRVLGIDFLGQLNPEDPKVFDPIGQVMDQLINDLAKPLQLTVILLIHSNRKRVNEEFGLSMGDGKGGRSIEQYLDTYIGLFKDHQNDRVLGRVLKHRDYEGEPYPQNPYFHLVVEKFEVKDLEFVSMDEIDDLQDSKKGKKKSITISPKDFL